MTQILMASTNLRAFESYFYKYTMQDNSLSQPNTSDTDFERIRTKYPEIKSQIEKKIQINSKGWKKMKKRYNLTYIFIEDIREKVKEAGENSVEMTEYLVKTFYDMFTDDETDLKKLLEKYTQQIQSKFNGILGDSRFGKAIKRILGDPNINKAKKETKAKSDEEFIQELVKFESFEGHDDIKEKIINTFIKEYYKWKKDDLPQEFLKSTRYNKQLENKLSGKYEEEKKNIEKNMFEEICNKIETKYKDHGSMRLNVLSIKKAYSNLYKFEHDIEEFQPKQLQITIYETSLKEENKFQIQENESFIPCPILLPSMNKYGISFCIDPQEYDFKKISQFDNRKFLLVLYNKKMRRIEIFFDTAQQLAQTIKPLIKLYVDCENFIIAINEPKGLLAVYNTIEVKLDVFSFDDNQSRLYGRNANIQLLQWYNNSIPNIKYFLFIKDTEDLCFVENSGRARVFNLVNLQFKPAVCNFPCNLVNVLSSPDGSCIVAFAKEILEVKPDEVDSIIYADNKKQYDNNNIIKEIINRAYVYFYKNFGNPASKEYQLGEWIIQLCCLIPIQIAVARNNLFQPLKDGLSSNENYPIKLEDGNFVDIVSKNISFGWYEGIFKHFGSKKVKVVSSMGEQSCGKSFMLNHLVGTTFDGSAMRCTEGVWMSLVNTKEYIYVALDFEGLKSLERTPQEGIYILQFIMT
ncbi:unnamed protein product [Rhizophagus irregularis]|nr:unnamed protein product [Rhizophagus irregularis]